MPEQRDWYDTPLYYDIIFDADTPKEGAFLDALHERYGRGGKSRQMLEPACGSGRLVLEMARRGWKVSGFDGNARMLEFAEERLMHQGLKARLWDDWMQSFELPRVQTFDFAHCLVSTFKYLLTEKDAVACLQRVAAVLKPGGIFALGVHLTDYANTSEDHERWVAERDGIHVTCNTHTWPADRRKRLEDIRTRLTIRDNGPGIMSENLSRVFEPFFTTKPKGTGLGLPITRRIIHEHRGTISVESQAGKGAAFSVVFPVPGQG